MRSRLRPRPARCLGAVLLLGLAVAACTASPAGSTAPMDSAAPVAGAVVLVVVGDSLTAGSEPLAGGEVHGEGSWVPAALGHPLVLGGGWASPGATTADMRSAVTPVDGDVLVLMAGTNDLTRGREWTVSRDDLLVVARTSGIDTVVVSAVPPYGPSPDASIAYNEALQQLSRERGWTFVDPWTPAAAQGRWADGASADGIHPVQAVADEAGRAIKAAVLARASGA